MKKIFFLFTIIISLSATAQLDTIYQRNLSLKGESWYWLKGGWTPSDSAAKKFYKKMRLALVAADPANSDQVVIDSVPGRICVLFYYMFKNSPSYIQEELGNEIRTKISAYTPLSGYLAPVNAAGTAAFQNQRKNGKEDIQN